MIDNDNDDNGPQFFPMISFFFCDKIEYVF
jgi:hypothetical protein